MIGKDYKMYMNDKHSLEKIETKNMYTYALNMGDFGICKWNIDKS